MQRYCFFLNLQIFQGCFFKKWQFFEKTVNEPTGQQVNETGGFGGVGRVGQVRQVGQVGREMMVDEVTTWLLGIVEVGDSKFREFEESTFRGFDNSWTCWAVDFSN